MDISSDKQANMAKRVRFLHDDINHYVIHG